MSSKRLKKMFNHLSVDLFYKKGILFYSTKSLSIFAFISEFKVKILKDQIRDQNLGSNLGLILKTMISGFKKKFRTILVLNYGWEWDLCLKLVPSTHHRKKSNASLYN